MTDVPNRSKGPFKYGNGMAEIIYGTTNAAAGTAQTHTVSLPDRVLCVRVLDFGHYDVDNAENASPPYFPLNLFHNGNKTVSSICRVASVPFNALVEYGGAGYGGQDES